MLEFLMEFISISQRFIFVHIYRTGGTSIKKTLKPYFSPKTFDQYSRKYFFQCSLAKLPLTGAAINTLHPNLRKIENSLSQDIFKDYFKFAFIRNPWDWQVSVYFHLLRSHHHRFHYFIKRLGSFENYVNYLYWKFKIFGPLKGQLDFILNSQNQVGLDFIGRFENFNEDFQKVLSQLSIDANLQHINASNHHYYKDYYTPDTAKKIEKIFSTDINYFGYNF